jgi:endonuclease/exonuclease/phosphatase family metal-dependent hydrolase
MEDIGPRLSMYDVVLVQEDFAEPQLLRDGFALQHASNPYERSGALDVGDGLNRYSRLPFVDHRRAPWRTCHGIFDSAADCLARKGLEVATHLLATGVEVDVYNVHLDAGRASGDTAARSVQVDQLLAAIDHRSAGRAVVVAGDTNLRSPDRAALGRLARAGLIDACATVRCDEPERIDRVYYRGSDDLELVPVRWTRLAPFDDEHGRPLSDHDPIVVELQWRRR